MSPEDLRLLESLNLQMRNRQSQSLECLEVKMFNLVDLGLLDGIRQDDQMVLVVEMEVKLFFLGLLEGLSLHHKEQQVLVIEMFGNQNVLSCEPWTIGKSRPTPGIPDSPCHWNVRSQNILPCRPWTLEGLGLYNGDLVVPVIEMLKSQNVLPCGPWTPGRPWPTHWGPGCHSHWNVRQLEYFTL